MHKLLIALIIIYLNNNKVATIVLNTTPSLTDNYIWISETSDNVVPGLDTLLVYLQSKYATIHAPQNAIHNIDNTINNEMLIPKMKLIIWKSPINTMSVNIYIITLTIQTLCIK